MKVARSALLISLSLRERAGVRGSKNAVKRLARANRKTPTDAERLLWRRLRGRQLEGCKFRRQEVIGPCIVDFVCLESKLVIELDGSHHMQQAKQDASRTDSLQRLGFRVLRFWNNDVLINTEAVMEQLRTALIETPSPQPSPVGRGGERKGTLV